MAISVFATIPCTMQADWRSVLADALNETCNDNSYSHRKSYHSSRYDRYDRDDYARRGLLTESQARSYIEQCIASLDHALRPHVRSYEVQQLTSAVKSALYNNRNISTWTSAGKRYKKDLIDQYINSAILEYIEKASYNYAYDRSGNRTIAKRVAESMRNNALARIAQAGALDADAITPFVGEELKKAVREAINRFDAPYDNNYRPSTSYTIHVNSGSKDKFYPSDDCCVCYDSFSSTERVFLQPCGHDICKDCAESWFLKNHKSSCPYCRTTINKQRLSQDLV